MKRIVCLILACLLLALPLCGCGAKKDGARVRIVCTVFPFYDWVRNIVGEVEGVEILWLADNGSDLHSFQPSASDMIAISSADLTVYAGGLSDAWIEEALKSGRNESGMPLFAVEGVTARPVASESGHDHEDGHSHEEDEHLWLSLQNAAVCVEAICERLCELDGENREVYLANAEAYVKKLRVLDANTEKELAMAESPRVLFADRFPFVYFLEDYEIEYRAAFRGCTTDVDADFSTVIELAKTLDEWSLRYVLVTESSDGALAESVIRASSQKDCAVLRLSSMQAVRRSEAEEGLTYLSAMEKNILILLQALELDLDD